MSFRVIRLFAVLLVLIPAALLAQQTRYISDELALDMRSGPGNQYRIQQMVPAGTRVTVLEESEGWARVQLGAGREGWVLSRLLSDSPSARSRLDEALETAASLEEENAQYSGDLQEAQERVEELESSLAAVSEERDTLEQQVGRAEEGLRLADENQEMRKQVIDLRREIQDLNHEIERLQERNDQRWFLVGGSVLFFGLLLGLILPKLGWRRRSSWSSGSL